MDYITFAHSSWGPKYKSKGYACQDYSDKQNFGHVQIIAVADGHGSNDCFRSDIGSELAVKTAFQMIFEYEVEGCFSFNSDGQQYLDSVNAEMKELPIIEDGLEGQKHGLYEEKAPSVDYNSWLQGRKNVYSAMSLKTGGVEGKNYAYLGNSFIKFSEDGIKSFKYQFWKRWRAAVKKDWDSKLSIYIEECKYNYGDNYKLEDLNNIIEEHESRFQKVSNKYKDRYLTKEADKYLYTAYGTTFLLALSIDSQILLLQIGDGTCVVMQRNGTFSVPVPADENNFLNVTVSLCEEDAYKKIRHAVLDKTVPELAPVAVFLSSDGLDDCYPVYHNDKYLCRLYYEILKKLSADSSAKALDELKQEIKDSLLPSMTSQGSQDDISLAFLVDNDINALKEALAHVNPNDINPDYEDEPDQDKQIEHEPELEKPSTEHITAKVVTKTKSPLEKASQMLIPANDYRRKKDYDRAFAGYYRAAAKGNILAYYGLGWCYENGKGVKIDKVKASECYDKVFRELRILPASEINCLADDKLRRYAQYVWGRYYEKIGESEKAKDCYKASAKLEYDEAQYKLGCLLLKEGQVEEAKAWLRKAAQQSYPEARHKLDDIISKEKDRNSREATQSHKGGLRIIGKYCHIIGAYSYSLMPKLIFNPDKGKR